MFYFQHLCETQNYWFIFFTITFGYFSLPFWILVGAAHLLCDMYEHLTVFSKCGKHGLESISNISDLAAILLLFAYCIFKKKKSVFTVFGTFLKYFTMFCIICESKYVIEFSFCLRSVGLFIVCYNKYKVCLC